MKVAIINNTKRIIICGGINLIPGANYVEDYLVKKAEDMLNTQEELENIEMPKADIDDDLSDTVLGGFNAKDAIKLVKETNDYDTLMTFQIEETSEKARKSVLQAIDAQIQASKAALKPQE